MKHDHLRELKSVRFFTHRLTDEWIDFCKKLIPSLKLNGYKLEQKVETAYHCLHNVLTAGLMEKTVADSREHENNLRVAVWDAIVKSGLAIKCTGSKMSKKVTHYYATDKLMSLRKTWELGLLTDMTLVRNTEQETPSRYALVVLHTGKYDWQTGEPLPDDEKKVPISLQTFEFRVGHTFCGYARDTENEIDRINQNNLKHSWMATIEVESYGVKRINHYQPNVCLRELHVGVPFKFMRLYSWGALNGQNISREQRSTILIDGEKTVELDYACHHLRLMYHLKEQNPEGDLYRPELIFPKFYSFENAAPEKKKMVRDLVKTATNICWFTTSKEQARRAVQKGIKDSSKDLKRIIYELEGLKAVEILDRMVDLMSLDGLIMKEILLKFVDAGKPALGIHDSLVVKESDAGFAEQTMKEVYCKALPGILPGFPPVIRKA